MALFESDLCCSYLISTRFIIGTWLLVSFIIAASYSGALKSHLTRPNYSKNIDSWEAVLDSGIKIEKMFGYDIMENFDPILDRVMERAEVIEYSSIINVRTYTTSNNFKYEFV